MSQSRRMSALEALANIVSGYALAVALQLAVYPAVGLSVTLIQSLKMGSAFTIASVLRSYVLRRIFERLSQRAAP